MDTVYYTLTVFGPGGHLGLIPDYSAFPQANTPYIACLVPYDKLDEKDKRETDARFMGTVYTTHKMEDYVYLCNKNGGVIARRLI